MAVNGRYMNECVERVEVDKSISGAAHIMTYHHDSRTREPSGNQNAVKKTRMTYDARG